MSRGKLERVFTVRYLIVVQGNLLSSSHLTPTVEGQVPASPVIAMVVERPVRKYCVGIFRLQNFPIQIEMIVVKDRMAVVLAGILGLGLQQFAGSPGLRQAHVRWRRGPRAI